MAVSGVTNLRSFLGSLVLLLWYVNYDALSPHPIAAESEPDQELTQLTPTNYGGRSAVDSDKNLRGREGDFYPTDYCSTLLNQSFPLNFLEVAGPVLWFNLTGKDCSTLTTYINCMLLGLELMVPR